MASKDVFRSDGLEPRKRAIANPFRDGYAPRRDYGTYHKEFAKDDLFFQKACELAGVQATRRQASKWRNNRGAAIKFKNEAKKFFELPAEGAK